MSKARLDLPDPLTPVTRVSWLRGIWISRFLRLFCRAPVMVIQPLVRVPLVLNRVLPYVAVRVSFQPSALSLPKLSADCSLHNRCRRVSPDGRCGKVGTAEEEEHVRRILV